MCGIAGFVEFSSSPANAKLTIDSMIEAIHHRGPDHSGVWSQGTVTLGHARLAIQDLSFAGNQPMHSHTGRYTIVFNGEIYNHQALRDELSCYPARSGQINWHGRSDTEVILAAVECWGFEETLARLVGMFALAIWDDRQRTLLLARDRMGEKPLYYARFNSTFLFASELGALKCHPVFKGNIDRNSLSSFIRYGYVPAPHSIFQGVKKLAPGTWLELSEEGSIRTLPYWAFSKIQSKDAFDWSSISDDEIKSSCERLLIESVQLQMAADVEVGAYLSGGVDSSLVVSLMQSLSDRPVPTFTVGFEHADLNEAHHAKKIAAYLGTSHTELYVSPSQVLETVPDLPRIFDEPFADSSQIPTLLLARMTRQHVKCCLSGDGADELFGGYNRYSFIHHIWPKISKWPKRYRSVFRIAINRMSPKFWSLVFNHINELLPVKLRYNQIGDKLYKIARIVDCDEPAEIYARLLCASDGASDLVIGGHEPALNLACRLNEISNTNFVEAMMFIDTIMFLPDDILVKLDRTAMSVGLETRVPMLDHRIVEFASQLPLSYKFRNGQRKWLLNEILSKYLPGHLFKRPKMGFGAPIETWLRLELKEWAEELLDPVRTRDEGYVNSEYMQVLWREHLSGRKNWQHVIWNVLMFNAWLRSQ